MNDQPDAEISSWQQTIIIREKFPRISAIRTRSPSKRAEADTRLRLRGQWARHLSILHDIRMNDIVIIIIVSTSVHLKITGSLRCKTCAVFYGSNVGYWILIPTGKWIHSNVWFPFIFVLLWVNRSLTTWQPLIWMKATSINKVQKHEKRETLSWIGF
jgi:hypothetical protein